MSKRKFSGEEKGNQSTPVKQAPERWTPESWITDDCKVRECSGGYIHFIDRGYDTVARCPRCKRARNPFGDIATGIPVYQGTITLRSEDEMVERRRERLDMVETKRLNYRVERMTEKIGA